MWEDDGHGTPAARPPEASQRVSAYPPDAFRDGNAEGASGGSRHALHQLCPRSVVGRKPKAKPARERIFNDLLYELTSIATNFTQLEAALEDENFGKWARYVGGELVERLMDRDDLIPLIEEMMERLNNAGHVVNALARSANVGKEIKDAEVKEVLGILQEVLEPLHKAAERPRENPHNNRDGGDAV